MNLWSLRRLGRIGLLRRAARRAVNLYYREGTIRTVRAGPLAGMRWACSRGQILWMPLGLYERETADWLASAVRPGLTFFDVGAHAGYFTLLGSRLCGAHGQVVAFEPNPHNIRSVQAQIDENGLNNTRLEPVALGAESGDAKFAMESETANSHLADVSLQHAASKPVGIVTVRTSTLDDFIAESGLEPSVVKIDVEGAEMLVLAGGSRMLRAGRPLCLVSTHSADLKSQCKKLLTSHGYDVIELDGFAHELVAAPARRMVDPAQGSRRVWLRA